MGLFSRLRRGKNKSVEVLAKPESAVQNKALPSDADSPTDHYDNDDIDLNDKGGGEMTQLKTVRFPASDAYKKTPGHLSRRELQKPPTAREAAYGGPPRYDWIDIETSAAIKVQSVFRRNQTMKQLEEQGMTTAAIRNRSRRRQARMNQRGVAGSGDIPSLLACCGVGLAFGEATEENYEATRKHESDLYLERKKEKEAREEELRLKFQKLSAQKKAAAARRNDVEEVLEVVDDLDE